MRIMQLPQTRYYLFGFMGFYPTGGINDLLFGFDKPNRCMDKLKNINNAQAIETFQIVDNVNHTCTTIFGVYALQEHLITLK